MSDQSSADRKLSHGYTRAELEALAAIGDQENVEAVESGELYTAPVKDPMITYSLRIPAAVADALRAEAAELRIKPTQLLRQLAEAHVERGKSAVKPQISSSDGGQDLEELLRRVMHEEIAPVRADMKQLSDTGRVRPPKRLPRKSHTRQEA